MINAAEAIICPFWDPELRELDHWTVDPGELHGLLVRQFWCWTSFEWQRPPDDGPALRMHRGLDVDCTGYDALIVSLIAPPDSVLEVTLGTDRGELNYKAPPAGTLKTERRIDLDGAYHLRRIVVEISEGDSGIRSGWFNWIGLQDTAAVPLYERRWRCYDAEWADYIKPPDYTPAFEPSLGIVATREEIEQVRTGHTAYLQNHGASPITKMADSVRGTNPEESIGEYVGFFSATRMTSDTRYNRERDHDKMLVTSGLKAATAGIILKDAGLMRLSARYAMSLAMCANWEDGMVNRFPGSNFDTRCFVQSLCLHDIAMILDLAGDLFTDLGRGYLLRRLSEEGLATVTYNTWKYEYLFHCNQLAWFSPGRMLASLVVERTWPRAVPHTDICYRDLVESMESSILPDGGYVEGPNYFQCVGRDANLAFYYYARGRNLDFGSIVPEIVKKTAGFGAAVASSDDSQDVFAICDAKPGFDQQALAFLDFLMPDTAWGRMLDKSLKNSGFPTSLIGAILFDEARVESTYQFPAIIYLSNTGIACSSRAAHDRPVRMLVMGNHAGAGHTHEDKGSFILEYSGDTFAMDPGTCDYSDPLSNILKGCERHNMLIPTGVDERPHPDSPIDVDVKPVASGDAHRFEAAIDLTPGWERYYRSWTRRIESPTPTIIEIEDAWELVRGEGVAFLWNTTLAVRIAPDESKVTVRGRNGTATMYRPEGSDVTLEELPLPNGKRQNRISFITKKMRGTTRVRVEIHAP